jgi:hypothetical protein
MVLYNSIKLELKNLTFFFNIYKLKCNIISEHDFIFHREATLFK